ncbi:calpain-2 catalytic subunit-like [Salminus brasiliensis]|uniref:calpain-2 catalytic subunit-like n=1 Tax=Salminus brasiliensis TaxID=930266 RepID=UPI003B837F29
MPGIAGKLQQSRARSEGLGQRGARALQYFGQDYEALRSACVREGRLFEDEKFEAGPDALGYKELGPRSYKTRGVTWQRPTELTTNPQFITEGATRTDICQGALGDCWLLAAIASLTLNQDILARVVLPGQSFEEDYAGIFHFQFWQYGEWVDVVVDDRLPTRDGKLLFVHSADRNEFWSALLEKAYAKLYGYYEALSGGQTCEASEDFTGGITEAYKLEKANPDLFRLIQEALSQGSLLSCSIEVSSSEADSEDVSKEKLVKGHAYSVTGAEEVALVPPGGFTCGFPWLCSSYELIQLIRIRNPWGKVEWKGPWSDGSAEWTGIGDADRARLRHKAEDGEFWMSFSDFLQHYSVLEICHLTPDALDGGGGVKKWTLSTFEGSWRRGSTAGGSRDFLKTFWMNPQFVIKLSKEDDDPSGCSFVVGLLQKNRRRRRRLGESLLTIGFFIYKLPAEYSGQRNVRLGRKFFMTHRTTAHSKKFINTREVCSRFHLLPGEYLIIPSTYQPHQDGDFCLRVFSETQAHFQELDDQVESRVQDLHISRQDQADGQFIGLFGQQAGEGCELSAFDLRSIFNKEVAKLTDLQTDGFSLQSCRNMVNLLDNDGSGKLSLVEFKILWDKIQSYGNIYNEKDEDKSGMMSSMEMRQAVEAAGFSVNNPLHQVLVARYSQPSLTVDFDDFVGCLVRLECMFKIFQTLDTDGSGEVEFNMMEWLSVTLL